MASVRVNPATNKLFLDFRYQSKRYREYTQLGNTKRNVARLEKLGEKIEMEIQSGTFCYYEHFPESASGKRFAAEALQQQTSQLVTAALMTRSEEHTSELQSRENLVCRLLLEKKNNNLILVRTNE